MHEVILVTGGSGSLGHAFVKEALKTDYRSIRIYSRNEYEQWLMKRDFSDDRLRFMVGDVRDTDRLRACFKGVDWVIHAAALKHVSTGQYNPQEVIKTNILGSVNIVDMAAQCGVKKVLGISSDKAVSPSCLYGSTKQIMETLFMEANRWANPGTKFSCLRSGNFFESRGNVFEIWAEQAKTGTLTLTCENMMRYFIPVEEVAKLCLKLLPIMKGTEVFVPKMQEYKMVDLLTRRYPKVAIKLVGKAEGEKIREAIFTDWEKPIECDDYYVIRG